MNQNHVYLLAKLLKTVAIVHPGHLKVKTHGVKLQRPWFDSKVVIFSDLCQILVSCPNLYYEPIQYRQNGHERTAVILLVKQVEDYLNVQRKTVKEVVKERHLKNISQ